MQTTSPSADAGGVTSATPEANAQTYLKALKWDGQSRLKNWLIFAVVGEPQTLSQAERARLESIGEQFLMTMVLRAMQPGCRVQQSLVLVGPQGCGKSTLLKTLAGEFFADVHWEKDNYQPENLAWLHEVCEATRLNSRDLQKLKALITATHDIYRPAYSRVKTQQPRSHVFAFTASDSFFLSNQFDQRYFWPVQATKTISVAHVAAMRDQLFAEALARLQAGESCQAVTA